MQNRLYWSDVKVCQGCKEEDGMEKLRLFHCPSWREVRNRIPEDLENGSRERKLQRKIGSDREELHRIP